MTTAAAEAMAYVGFAPCGCARALTVDVPEARREVARDVARFVRDGLRVERRTVAAARGLFRRCPHRAGTTGTAGGTD